MADDPRYRSPNPDPYSRDRTSRSAGPPDDPLAELARLIGQDEAFIAASREGTRTRHRDAPHEREAESSAPNWLGRAIGGRNPHDERADAHTDTDWRGARRPSEFSAEAAHESRPAAREWAPPFEERDGREGETTQEARGDWNETGYQAPADEEFDPHRIAGGDRRYDRIRGEESYERYDDD